MEKHSNLDETEPEAPHGPAGREVAAEVVPSKGLSPGAVAVVEVAVLVHDEEAQGLLLGVDT